MNTSHNRGFTVIELLAVTALLIVIGVLFWNQRSEIESTSRDDKRKISINALYYSLEKVYKPTKKSYPKTLSADTLPSVDKALFNDPNGVPIGSAGSSLRYEPTACDDSGICQHYTLRADLENEADFVKSDTSKD